MAQTVGAIGQGDWEAQVSVDGSSWVDIEGVATSLSFSGQEQMSGHINTAGGVGAPIVVSGNKWEPIEATVTIVYTEVTNEAFDRVYDQWQSPDKRIYFRWAPKGGIGTVVGNYLFTLADGNGNPAPAVIMSILPPELDTTSGDPATCSFTLKAPQAYLSLTTTS